MCCRPRLCPRACLAGRRAAKAAPDARREALCDRLPATAQERNRDAHAGFCENAICDKQRIMRRIDPQAAAKTKRPPKPGGINPALRGCLRFDVAQGHGPQERGAGSDARAMQRGFGHWLGQAGAPTGRTGSCVGAVPLHKELHGIGQAALGPDSRGAWRPQGKEHVPLTAAALSASAFAASVAECQPCIAPGVVGTVIAIRAHRRLIERRCPHQDGRNMIGGPRMGQFVAHCEQDPLRVRA